MMWVWFYSFARVVGLTYAALGLRGHSLPPINTNQNHLPAGVLRDGVLSVDLQIVKGAWHPESDDGVAVSVYAFGEVGRPLENPGPLIRVPQGTIIHTSVRNTLDVPVTVHGLSDPAVGESDVGEKGTRIAPGAVTHITFKASTAGLYFYWGGTEANDLKLRHGIDAELTGA